MKYRDWLLDSEEELVFCYWLEELQENGFVDFFYRIEEPILSYDKINFDFIVGGKKISKHILRRLSYTPDFLIKWNEKADGKIIAIKEGTYTKKQFKNCIFYCESDKQSIIDVKGPFGRKLISGITFPILQKVLAYNGTFVQKIVPLGNKGLFSKTFTPKQYLLTKTGKIKKINWTVKSVTEYLNL